MSSLPVPPAWTSAATCAATVPMMWALLDVSCREEGLRELWLGKGETGAASVLHRWTRWLDAGLPVDAMFCIDEYGTVRTTLLGHAMLSGEGPLMLAALDAGADPNQVALAASHGAIPASALMVSWMARRAAGEAHAMLPCLLRAGWDPTLSLDGPVSFVGACVEHEWLQGLKTLAQLKPGLDWNALNKNARPVLSLFVGGSKTHPRWTVLASWLMEQGARPRALPERDRVPFVVQVAEWNDAALLAAVLDDLRGMFSLPAARAAMRGIPSRAASRGLALLEAHEFDSLLVSSPSSSVGRRQRF